MFLCVLEEVLWVCLNQTLNFKQTFFFSQLTDSSLLSVVHEARGLMGKSQRSCDSYVQVEKH